MSALKKASYKLTHLGAPPFLEAQSVPENSYKCVKALHNVCYRARHVQVQEDSYGGSRVDGCV